MKTSETRDLAKGIAKELLNLSNISLCEWISEEKLLSEIPLSKSQIEKYRNNSALQRGFHYKSLGQEESRDNSRRGRKTLIYHRNRMMDFIDSL